jgi:signal transduction histidine kinase
MVFSKIGFHTPSLGFSQKFALSAGFTIAVSMGLLAAAISQRIETSMMQSAAEEGALFIEVFLGPSAQDLVSSSNLSPEGVRKLDDLLAGKLGERVRLIKIWLPDGTLVYSTNKKEAIGARFPSVQITEAVKGKVTGEFDHLDDLDNVHARQLDSPLVEIHAPLYRTGTQEIIAVGEVYSDGSRLAADLSSIRYVSAGIVGAVTAPMMLILFLMVRRASNLVRTYQTSLMKKMIEAKGLAAQNDRLRRAAENARLEAANSNEKLLARIGQDLHDGPVQLVSLLMLKLTASTGKPPVETGCGGLHSDPQALTARLLDDLRSISSGLVLPELEGLTANEALQLAVERHEDATGTKVTCQIRDLPRDTPLPLTICLYRIVQEGLHNAFRHGEARGQHVKASADTRSADASWIVITVSDNGPGLGRSGSEKPRSRTGLGIAGLRNRVEALQGTFELISRPGIGTRLRAKLPITRSSK